MITKKLIISHKDSDPIMLDAPKTLVDLSQKAKDIFKEQLPPSYTFEFVKYKETYAFLSNEGEYQAMLKIDMQEVKLKIVPITSLI